MDVLTRMIEDRAFRDAYDAAGLGLIVLDEAGLVTGISPQACHLLQRDAQEVVGALIGDVAPFGSASDLFARLQGQSMRAELDVVDVATRDGRLTPLLPSLSRWVTADGAVRYGLTLRAASDQPAERLQRDRERYLSQNAIRSANLAVFEYDPIADRVIVSDIWRQMLEIGTDEVLDEQVEWRSRVHPDDLEAALEPVRLCLANLAERAVCEYRLRSRDGCRWRWRETEIAVQARNSEGQAIRLIGVQKDITERKEMEAAHRVAVDEFRSAFEHAPIGKAIVGLDGRFLMVNPAICAFLGRSEEALLETTCHLLTHPDDLKVELEKVDQLTAGLSKSFTLEKRYLRADGTVVWGLQSVAMVPNAEGAPDHFVAQVVDVTEQRRLSEMKSEFVSHVSHELRTPLTSILGALGLLQTFDDDAMSDEARRLLYIAQVNGDRLKNLVNDILDFQSLSATRMRFALTQHSAAQLIDDAILANLATADTLGVRFRSRISDRSLGLQADAARFQQVMTNLLTNAAKFADPGSTVEIMAEQIGDAVRISVTNTGPGIPELFRDDVFKPFAQAVPASNSKTRGTGLGLTISKGIVEQMGGEIGFESVPGAKTTFWLTLPVSRNAP